MSHIFNIYLSERNKLCGMLAMGEFKHFVIVKFKEGVAVDELTKGMEKLVSEIDAVKSFEWYVFSFLNYLVLSKTSLKISGRSDIKRVYNI